MIMGRKYKSYSYDDWKKAMDLHNKYKFGHIRISRILGINENTVKKWLYYGVVPPSAKWKAELSKKLAYAIGVIQGDACVTKNESKHHYIIELNTIDKEFAEVFSKVMAKLLNANYHKPYWSNKRRQWRVIYKSKAFYLWYKRTEKKGLQGFKPFIEYNKSTVKHYLRGLYDSEGNNNGNKQIRLYNSKKKLLEYIQYLLKRYFGIKTTGPYLRRKNGTKMMINERRIVGKHDCYEIVISRKEHVQKFLREIGFTITRKQLGLKKHEKFNGN